MRDATDVVRRSSDPTATPRRTVLVVDDTEANRYAVGFWLREAGFAVIEAGSGAEAIERATRELPDLVVLDIRLPDTTGFEVFKQLRGEPRTAAIPVVHLSASFATGEWRARGLEAGAEAYLTHPVEPRELVATVRSLLRMREVDVERSALLRREHDARVAAESAQVRIARLQEVTAELSGALTAAEVADVAVRYALSTLGARSCHVVLRSADGRWLERITRVGTDDRALPRGAAPLVERFPVDAPFPSAHAVRTGQPVVIHTGDELRARFPELAEEGAPLEIQSLAGFPLAMRGEPPLGAVIFAFAEPRALAPDTLAFMRALADQCAQALERARLYDAERSARREAEQARAAAERAAGVKADFLATMSHEFRTPLNAISGYIQLMEMEIAGPVTPAQREYLERLRASSMHLRGLVDDVLDLAKLDAGGMTVARERGDASAAVGEALALMGPQADGRGVRLVERPGTRVPHYLGDVGRVRQIVLNLLSNAVKFTEPGGSVTIEYDLVRGDRAASDDAAPPTPGPWLAIRVTDTGSGIASQRQQAIFEPFVQAETGHTRTKGGTGLGLTISRRLARLMGGDLTVRSEEGVGSEFTLWLPAEDE